MSYLVVRYGVQQGVWVRLLLLLQDRVHLLVNVLRGLDLE